jgi:hypothetical protein
MDVGTAPAIISLLCHDTGKPWRKSDGTRCTGDLMGHFFSRRPRQSSMVVTGYVPTVLEWCYHSPQADKRCLLPAKNSKAKAFFTSQPTLQLLLLSFFTAQRRRSFTASFSNRIELWMDSLLGPCVAQSPNDQHLSTAD